MTTKIVNKNTKLVRRTKSKRKSIVLSEKNINSLTVHSLREAGYKVRILHYRYFDEKNPSEISPKGGQTVVQLTDLDGVTIEGVSRCSQLDSYVKAKGFRAALGRAIKYRQVPTLGFTNANFPAV